jgi:hypothetical protein
VFAGQGSVAVSNYHRRRPLPMAYEPVARQALEATRRLAESCSQIAFSADFLLAESGSLLFLEGGLGYDHGAWWMSAVSTGHPGRARLRSVLRVNERARRAAGISALRTS